MNNNDTRNKTNVATGNYKRVIKYLGIFGGAQGVSVLFSMVRNKAASVLLGAAGLGVIALYNRTIQLFCDFTGLSLSMSAVRRMSDAYSNEDDASVRHCIKVVRSIALLSGLVGMLLMMLMSPLLAQWMFDGESTYALRLALLSPIVFCLAVSSGELAVLRGVKQPGKIALYTLWTAVSSVLATVPLYYVWRADGIFPALLLVALLQMGGVLYFSTRLYAYRAAPFFVEPAARGA